MIDKLFHHYPKVKPYDKIDELDNFTPSQHKFFKDLEKVRAAARILSTRECANKIDTMDPIGQLMIEKYNEIEYLGSRLPEAYFELVRLGNILKMQEYEKDVWSKKEINRLAKNEQEKINFNPDVDVIQRRVQTAAWIVDKKKKQAKQELDKIEKHRIKFEKDKKKIENHLKKIENDKIRIENNINKINHQQEQVKKRKQQIEKMSQNVKNDTIKVENARRACCVSCGKNVRFDQIIKSLEACDYCVGYVCGV